MKATKRNDEYRGEQKDRRGEKCKRREEERKKREYEVVGEVNSKV